MSCQLADSETAYYYQRMASKCATTMDDVSMENPKDLTA